MFFALIEEHADVIVAERVIDDFSLLATADQPGLP
jgi:hypothetical protein